MKEIKKLEGIVVEKGKRAIVEFMDKGGNIEETEARTPDIMEPPSTFDIMDKVNEIIDVVNELQKTIKEKNNE